MEFSSRFDDLCSKRRSSLNQSLWSNLSFITCWKHGASRLEIDKGGKILFVLQITKYFQSSYFISIINLSLIHLKKDLKYCFLILKKLQAKLLQGGEKGGSQKGVVG